MNSKLKAWSEGSTRATAGDITSGLGGLDDSVQDTPVQAGILLQTSQCMTCGWQMKHILKWGEVAMYFLGQLMPGDRSAAFTRQGVQVALQCKHCASVSPIMIPWFEVEQYADLGIRHGYLKPAIRQARQKR